MRSFILRKQSEHETLDLLLSHRNEPKERSSSQKDRQNQVNANTRQDRRWHVNGSRDRATFELVFRSDTKDVAIAQQPIRFGNLKVL